MFPGRWNRKAQRAVYTSTSIALALNGTLIHLPKESRPAGYSLMTITVQPENVVLRRTLGSARKWFDTTGQALREYAEDPFALIAPSVIVPEYNVVLYPRLMNFEPEFVRIEAVEEFNFDSRFFDKRL
jgi:RES domain-containing protein